VGPTEERRHHRAGAGAEFDAYASSYDAELARGLALTGEDKDFYARGRIAWLARRLAAAGVSPRRVLDFGCGTGTAAPLLRDLLGAELVLGIDPSSASLEQAHKAYGGASVRFAAPAEYQPDGSFDLVFTNGVLHHVPRAERLAALRYVAAALRPGGWFALWENNPWNPGTRWIMGRVAFDRDAVMLSAAECRRLARQAGLEPRATDYLFVFPRVLRLLRPLEPWLRGLPLGGQYQVLSRKPSE
jgi:SAM-dependent methyltransferase